jgi:hypothetical protein
MAPDFKEGQSNMYHITIRASTVENNNFLETEKTFHKSNLTWDVSKVLKFISTLMPLESLKPWKHPKGETLIL